MTEYHCTRKIRGCHSRLLNDPSIEQEEGVSVSPCSNSSTLSTKSTNTDHSYHAFGYDEQQQETHADESKMRKQLAFSLPHLLRNSKITHTAHCNKISALTILVFLILMSIINLEMIISTVIVPSATETSQKEHKDIERKESNWKSMVTSFQKRTNIDLSIVIFVTENNDHLAKLLSTIINQKGVNFEVIVVDNVCLPETKKKVVFEKFHKGHAAANIPNKYVPLCDNSSSAVGSNKGVEVSSELSKWVMFLHDDVVLQGEDFLENMMDTGETMYNAGGAVCKLLNENQELIEAGSIFWNDASSDGIGNGEEFSNAPTWSYAKPVDFGSGACLMIKKTWFSYHKGFDYVNFPTHYKDADLQLYVQHNLGEKIWFQPNAVAIKAKDNGSLKNQDDSTEDSSFQIFTKKWRNQLDAKHLENPRDFADEHQKELQFMRASDLRARDTSKANILWLEQAAPNPENGSGFERAFDNLSIAAELGHKITLILYQKITNSWCDKECRDRIRNLGVELITGPWDEYVDKYSDFYDIVYVSRPAIFHMTYKKWQEAYEKHTFTLIYDCEALWYKRDQMIVSLLRSDENNHEFPGGVEYLGLTDSKMDTELINLVSKNDREIEMKLISMADSVIAVSEKESRRVLRSLPHTQLYTVGHSMSRDESEISKGRFNERNGILFLSYFGDNMYYNGDAVWYFLTEVYPLVLEESPSPIPFTIAGKHIPRQLYELVEKDDLLSQNVIFAESVVDTNELYDTTRMVIAPHLYAAGIDYKVSEAFSLGIPTVMSSVTADTFGITYGTGTGCVAKSSMKIKDCILDLNASEEIWDRTREKELEFIHETQSRSGAKKVLDDVINYNLKKIKNIRKEGDRHKMEHSLMTTKFNEAKIPCSEGETYYSIKYPDVKEAVDAGIFESYFSHYHQFGKNEGKKYLCFEYKDDPMAQYFIDDLPPEPTFTDDPTESCPEGEVTYGRYYPEVMEEIAEGIFTTCFDHYERHGKEEGKKYICAVDSNSYVDYQKKQCPRGEDLYARRYPDVKQAVTTGVFESYFHHYELYGRVEGKKYTC